MWGWGRRGWWRYWAGQAERWWRTRLGNGHNYQNSTAALGELSAEADEAQQIDSTRMGGCSWLLPWTREEVQDIKLTVTAVVQPQTNDDAPAPPPTTFGELMETLDTVPGISQRPQGTSQPGNSKIRLGSVKPQWKSIISSGEPAEEPDSSTLLNAKRVDPASVHTCI